MCPDASAASHALTAPGSCRCSPFAARVAEKTGFSAPAGTRDLRISPVFPRFQLGRRSATCTARWGAHVAGTDADRRGLGGLARSPHDRRPRLGRFPRSLRTTEPLCLLLLP